MRYSVGKGFIDFLDEFVVEHVALRDGEYAVLVEQLGVKLGKLVEQDFIFLGDVVGIGGHHEQQHGVTFDVAEESQSESLALAGALDYARNVGHDERAVVAVAHDA